MFFIAKYSEKEVNKLVSEKVQPHCIVCKKPFKRKDIVFTDKIFRQIQHAKCFIYKKEYILDKGPYEQIVNKYPVYNNMFLITDNPVTVINIYKEK